MLRHHSSLQQAILPDVGGVSVGVTLQYVPSESAGEAEGAVAEGAGVAAVALPIDPLLNGVDCKVARQIGQAVEYFLQ